MMSSIFVSILQAVAGEPEVAAPASPADQAVEQPAPPQADVRYEQARITCRTVRATGSRVRRERVCQRDSNVDDLRDSWRRFQETGGATQPRELGNGGG